MADQRAEAIVRNLEKGNLQEGPRTLTEAQELGKKYRLEGREHWKAALLTHQAYTTTPEENGKQNAESKEDKSTFLGCPGEIRNMIYNHYLADFRSLHGSQSLFSLSSTGFGLKMGGTPQSQIQTECDIYLNGRTLYKGVMTAFKSYQDAHAIKVVLGGQRNSTNTPDSVHVSERGNLFVGLPALALTCHQVLGEMRSLFFSPEVRYIITVKNFDFFPMFRFFRFLNSKAKAQVPGRRVDIVLEDDTDEQATAGTKYDKIKKLIKLHWLENLPLWGSITGKREEKDFGQKPARERRSKQEFWRWMARVRHMHTLYHIERKVWRKLALKYLDMWHEMDRSKDPLKTWTELPDEDLVEAMIQFISDAIDYRCGYIGLWGGGAEDQLADEDLGDKVKPASRCGEYFLRSNPTKIAHVKEHAVVHLAERMCSQIEAAVRKVLRGSYDKWTELDDSKCVPIGTSL